jgi:hypothetical protein
VYKRFLGTSAFLGTGGLSRALNSDPRAKVLPKDLVRDPGAGVLAFSGENSLPTLGVNSSSGILAATEAALVGEDDPFAGEELFS